MQGIDGEANGRPNEDELTQLQLPTFADEDSTPKLNELFGGLDPWPHQSDAFHLCVDEGKSSKSFVLSAPTGAGKSLIFLALVRHAHNNNETVAIYCCRNSLLDQLIKKCISEGIPFGTRAAKFRKYRDTSKPLQLCSLDTVYAAYKKDEFAIPRAHKVIVDEAHQQKAKKAEEIFGAHAELGAQLTGFTATPCEINHLYEEVYQVCMNSDLRSTDLEPPAHLPARVYACPELDTDSLKPIKTGEYSVNDIRKSVWTPQIFGHVFKHYQRLNPEGYPTILFAPGVAESKWFVDMFESKGVAAAHVDGDDCYREGEEKDSSPEERARIVDDLKAGVIKILCNRFVFREGVDIPELYHLILATPIGGLVSYVQTVGRVLRYYHLYDHVIVQDHGGCIWRHGSPNADRDWTEWFHMTNAQISELHKKRIQNGDEDNPIRCPKCGAVRASGLECPACGYKSSINKRMVIQQNGELRQVVGDPVPRLTREFKNDTEELWKKCYYRCKNSNMTFNQAEGLFYKENYYYPPRDLPGMPVNELDWWDRINRVPFDDLYPF